MKRRQNILVGFMLLLILITSISFAGEIDYPVPCKTNVEVNLVEQN